MQKRKNIQTSVNQEMNVSELNISADSLLKFVLEMVWLMRMTC